VAGRASLRQLLGQLLHMAPAQVPLVRGARGRPHIDLPGAPDFNVSNTRECALIAVCTDPRMRVGVDIEHRERATAALKLARKFLAQDEQQALDRYPPALQREHFLRWWTCKEAMSKATGDGLSAPFSRLHVAIEPELALLQGQPPYTAADWQLCAVAVPDGFLGTLAQWTPPIAPAPGAA
jgi:4'-phosphopantetheinyl transferase